MVRMYRAAFQRLFDMLSPYIMDTNEEMARRSSGSPISKRAKVLCTLRFLAGASYLDLMISLFFY